MFDFIAILIFSLVLPMLINKSTEKGRLDWIEPYLRIIWTAVFAFFSIYLLQKPMILGVAMELHNKLSKNPLVGYLICAAIGAIMLCVYWWLSGELFPARLTEKKDDQKHPTAKEIAAEIAKKITKPEAPLTPQKSINQPKQEEFKITASPQIVMQLPTVGNLRQRTISLSEEIMEDLYNHGWKQYPGSPHQVKPTQQMPDTAERLTQWIQSRSRYFRFRFYERVLDLRNEFSQLHLRDQRLDDFLKHEGMVEDANKHIAATGIRSEINSPIPPQQIEEVAERLKILADQIKNQ